LSELLKIARNRAVANLAACQEANVCCSEAVFAFQAAEVIQDDAQEDKTRALSLYWTASLRAQILRMLFRSAPKK
jgi:hypothetical protein